MKRALLFIAATLAFASPAVAFAAVPTISVNSDADGITTGDITVKAYATFSEAVSGFDLGDIQITNGTVSLLIQQSPTFYSFLVTVQGSGAITVTATIPADAVQSVSTLESNTSGTDSWDYDSSLTTFTTVSGRSWYDANHDGIRTSSGSCSSAGDNCSPAAETDLEGTTITAAPVLDGAGTADPDRAAISTTTNVSGSYSFLFGSTVDTGRWRISETLPSGWTQTLPTATDTFYDVTINDTDGTGDSVTRENYASANNFNFGSYDPSLVVAVITPLATPTTTPEEGTYTSIQSVSLGTASSSATTTVLYYTLDNSTPDCPSTGTPFSSSISIASSATLKAIACSDSASSTVASFSYTINIPPDPPTASPATTTAYTSAQDITLSDASTTASIYYTNDDSSPYCGASTLFSSGSPVHLTVNATLKAVACTSTGTSTVASFAYVINIPVPDPEPASGGGNGPVAGAGAGVSASGNAVIPTAPDNLSAPQSRAEPQAGGVVLGTMTVQTPVAAAAPAPASEPDVAPPPAPKPTTQNIAAAPAAPATTTDLVAAAGLASTTPFSSFGPILAALILALLLASWALWSWLKSGTSH